MTSLYIGERVLAFTCTLNTSYQGGMKKSVRLLVVSECFQMCSKVPSLVYISLLKGEQLGVVEDLLMCDRRCLEYSVQALSLKSSLHKTALRKLTNDLEGPLLVYSISAYRR